ncbi:hypothetical protein SO802_002156 [Lithocarpus litseifolius]|uniref:Uncharacterized protein n=1 Tax=Lithocarpus litseifolius TaxID=425828 RepID=A0AAW2DWZ6_9ROSI
MNSLPTRLNLSKRGMNICPKCPTCDQEVESIPQSLIYYESARHVWRMWMGCPINFGADLWDFTDVALKILHDGTTQDLEIFSVTAWSIWYSRNQNVFENTNHSPEQVWSIPKALWWDYKEPDALCNRSQHHETIRWEAPPLECTRLM